MSNLKCFTVFLCLWWCLECHGFNLETRLPIIKRGQLDSYFGYSVAEHQTSKSSGINWLLVGAPIGQNLQPNTNRSGALFRCKVNNDPYDCEQVVTDGLRTVESDSLSGPMSDEKKDNQWLGVTVKSQGSGGKVLVCAHRYMKTGVDSESAGGLCYILKPDLKFDEPKEPCKGKPLGHQQYGYCQAGISGYIASDNTTLLGTPGPYVWKGTVFANSIDDDYLHRDKNWYSIPVQQASPVDKYSYLGMSVSAANFFGDSISYVAGAPRGMENGQVIFFSKPRRQNGLVSVLMGVDLTLVGEQFASSFGYELATADVNGDKLPDLIVGAPFFFAKEAGGAVYVYLNKRGCNFTCSGTKPTRITGKPESRFGFAISSLNDLNKDGFDDIAVGAPYEGMGAVYIFLGSAKGIIVEPSQVIRAEDVSSGGRGFALRSLGASLSGGMDMDNNGYPDLLMGAYESDAVVLLRARPIIDIITSFSPERNLLNIDPSQPGCSEDTSTSLTCFSFQTCCTIESVLKSRGASIPMAADPRLTLRFRLEAETFPGNNRKFSRVWFRTDNDSQPSVIEKTIELRPDRKSTLRNCQNHTVYIKEKTRDIQSPIKFKLSYVLVQRQPETPGRYDRIVSLDNFPILNQQEAAKTFDATFQKNCGEDEICESLLVVEPKLLLDHGTEPNTWKLTLGENQEILMNVTISNQREPAYETQLFVVHPSTLSYIGRKIEGKQLACQPHNATLLSCSIGNPFKENNIVHLQLRFDPKHLDDTQSLLEFIVFANTTSKDIGSRDTRKLKMEVLKHAAVSLRGSARPENVFYAGEVRGESSIKYFDEIGTRIVHTYQVYNSGPWRVSTLDVHIEWPYQVANNKPQGKWLLYLEETPKVDAQSGGDCTMLPNQVNPLGIINRPGVQETSIDDLLLSTPRGLLSTTVSPLDNETNRTRRRVRREQEVIIKPMPYTDSQGRHHQFIDMNCLIGTAKCFKFRCTVNNLLRNQEATIRIRARLWNATLVEDYPRVSWVRIMSRARVHIPHMLGIQNDVSDDSADVETLAYPDLLDQQESEPVSIWIIIVAVVIGLVLLILLSYVLWKVGFFKRRRPDPTLSGNLEKHRRDDF